MEVVSFLADGDIAYIWISTDILNILTGAYVFAIFVCKPNVWKLLKIKIPCLKKLDDCWPFSFTGLKRRSAAGDDTIDNDTTTTMSSVLTLMQTSIVALNEDNHHE